MDEEIKIGIKKVAKGTEAKLIASLLRWKYKKEGKVIPPDDGLEQQSRHIRDHAHDVIAKRGRNVWREIKEAYYHNDRKKEDPHH